ncbi:ABC transporter ATP-binding protein, partial [Candidatus Omnitrophota bacterium]
MLSIFVLSIFYAFFEGLNIVVLFPIISSMVEGSAKAGEGSSIITALNKLIEIMPIKDMFIAACVFVIIIVVFKSIFRYSYMVLSAFASYKIWEDVQKRLFSKYISADYRYFLDHKQGEIVYRLFNSPASVGGILKLIPQILTEILKIIVIGVILFSMSLPVTCGVIVIGGIFYFFTGEISRKISYFIGKGRMEAGESQNILINEMIKQIKVFLGEKRWILNFHRAVDKYFKLSKRDTLWINMPLNALEIFALVTLSIFLIFVRKFSPQSLISNLPLLAVFAYAFQRIMPSLSLITNLRMQIMGGLPILEILCSVINEKMTYLTDGAKVMTSFNEKIEFDNVSFSYPGRREALSNAAITFEKNKCIAIVGQSGSGKTTMVNLLIRLFDPTEGAILIDGINLIDYKKDSWLKRIGFVSQDTFIFHASVGENIKFGLDNVSKKNIIESAKTANAHDFITTLPEGYDTVVGEKGMKLSGGEQQRIAIARAI